MANPIIQRELIGLLRTRRAFGLQLGLSLVLGILVLLRWPPDAQVNLTGDQSQQVFQLFVFGLMVGLILLAPVFPASSIVRERQQGTLALLLNSPLRPWDILFGKLVGVLGYVLILLVLSLPAGAACWAMGGLSLGSQMFLAYGILTLAAVQYASAALFISTRAANTDTSLRATYGVVLLMAVVVLGPFEFLGRLVTGPLGTTLEWIRCISPIPAMLEILGQSAAGSSGIMSMEGAPFRYAVLAGISILIFNGLTLARLNLRMFDRPRNAGKITDERSTGAQVFRRIMYLWFFDPQRRSGLIGDSTNPVMIKEFRCSKFGRGHWMMRLIGGCLIVSLGLTLASANSSTDWGVEKMGAILVLLQMALLILVTPSLASGLISTEREGGGWQLLQMTPLGAFTIIAGKLLAVWRTLLLLIMATLPGYALMVFYVDQDKAASALEIIFTLFLTAAFAILLSAAISSLFRRTAVATAVSYTLLLLICAGTMLVWMGRGAPFTPPVVQAVLLVNPLAAALQAIRAPGFEEYNLIPQNWWILGGGCLLSLIVLIVQTRRLTRPR